MSIDRIDWHIDAVDDSVSYEEKEEIAGAHIGYYLEWAYKNGFAPSNPETNDVAECQKVAKSEVNGIQFLINNCDGKFWDVDLNEDGLQFTNFAYENYLKNLETVFGHKPYVYKYNKQDFEKTSTYLDKIYNDYLANKKSNNYNTNTNIGNFNNIFLYRKKAFTGHAVSYHIILNEDIEQFKNKINNLKKEELLTYLSSLKIVNIKDREKIKISISDPISSIFISLNELTNNKIYPLTLSNQIKITSSQENSYFQLITKFHWKGQEFLLESCDKNIFEIENQIIVKGEEMAFK